VKLHFGYCFSHSKNFVSVIYFYYCFVQMFCKDSSISAQESFSSEVSDLLVIGLGKKGRAFCCPFSKVPVAL
jgi:hypothetical protein